MIKHDKIQLIIADEGKLLTQSSDVSKEDRTFSSRVYDSNMGNWTEWTQDDVEKFIQERESATPK